MLVNVINNYNDPKKITLKLITFGKMKNIWMLLLLSYNVN